MRRDPQILEKIFKQPKIVLGQNVWLIKNTQPDPVEISFVPESDVEFVIYFSPVRFQNISSWPEKSHKTQPFWQKLKND